MLRWSCALVILVAGNVDANEVWALGDFETTSTTFVEVAPQLTLNADAGSNLLLFFTAELMSSATGAPAMEFFVGQAPAFSVWGRGAVRDLPPNTPVPWTVTDFAGGSTGALRFQLRAVTPGSKAYVRNLTVIAIELPASDFVFVEDLMRVDVAAGGWAPMLTLSVPRAGSWTVLAGATATATPDGGVALRVSDRLQRAPPSWSDGGPRTFGLLDGPGWPQLLTVRTHQLEPGEVITLEAMAAPGSGLQADSGTVAALLDTRLMAFSSPLVSVTSLNTQGSTSLSTGSAPIIDVTQSEGAGTAYLQLQHVHAAPFIAGPATVVLEGRGALTTVARAGLEGHHLSATSAKAWVGTGAMLTSRVTGVGSAANPLVVWGGSSAVFVLGAGLRVFSDGGVGGGADGGPLDAGFFDGGSSDGGSSDGGSFDGGGTDGGPLDAGSSDGGSFDGGSSDGGSLDAGPLDAGGAFDAGDLDAGTLDAGDLDAGPLDAGAADAGLAGAAPGYRVGCGCTSWESSAGLWLGLSLLVTLRRLRR